MPGQIDSMGPGVKTSLPNLVDVPSPTGPVPTPILSTSLTPMTEGGVMTILHNFLPGCNMLSSQPLSLGSPFPGTVSKGAFGKVQNTKGSDAVFYQNQPVTTLGDPTMQDANNAIGNTVAPSQAKVFTNK